MTSRIYFAGDTHGQHEHIVSHLIAEPDAVIIHVGDFELSRPAIEEFPDDVRSRIWWIYGNHDFDRPEHWSNLFNGDMRERCLHGRVVDIGGIRIAGLGGNFQQRVWMPPNPPAFPRRATLSRTTPRQDKHQDYGVPLKRAGAIWQEDVLSLSRKRADILVCHEAPSTHQYGFEVLDELARSLRASWIIHGHHHDDSEGMIDNQIKVRCVALRKLMAFDAEH